ncbi:MAG: response regulator transcription factor [Clostridiaceae bacterium]|nr:response regulator transcription factor [Clostridiaceae bacterium]
MKILLIDDHPLVRKGLASVLSLEKDIEIVGEAGNISDALKAIELYNPDLVLVDIRLGNEDGLDIIEKSRSKNATCKFIILTSSGSDDDFKRAEEAGALGYILKEALPEELLLAVRLVSKGRKYYDPGIMELLMKESSKNDQDSNLTAREKEVLKALGEGLSNKDIAEKLYITEYTVKKHVSQILSKLELADRTQAALYAHSKGYVN